MNQPRFRDSDDPQEMAARIRAARAWAGLTRDQLAEKMDRSKSTVERWEKGDLGPAARSREKRSRLWLDLSRATGIWVGFFIQSWDHQADNERSKKAKQLFEEATQETGQRLEQRLARIEEALGISPEMPDVEEVERDLEAAFSEADEPRGGKPPASETRREAG